MLLPLTPLEDLYRSLPASFANTRGQAAQIARAKAYEANPDTLSALFEASIAALDAYDNHSEPFYPTPRGPFAPTRARTDTRSIARDLERPEPWPISGSSQRFRYVDRELRPLRTTGGARYDRSWIVGEDPRSARSAPLLDVLLVDDLDHTPIVGEIKIGGDQNLFYALVQGLMHVAALHSAQQRRRLRRAYPEAHFAPDGKLDLFLMTIGPPLRGTRVELAASARKIAEQQVRHADVAAVIRSIVCLESDSNRSTWAMKWRAPA
jgi:hypothetical protein